MLGPPCVGSSLVQNFGLSGLFAGKGSGWSICSKDGVVANNSKIAVDGSSYAEPVVRRPIARDKLGRLTQGQSAVGRTKDVRRSRIGIVKIRRNQDEAGDADDEIATAFPKRSPVATSSAVNLANSVKPATPSLVSKTSAWVSINAPTTRRFPSTAVVLPKPRSVSESDATIWWLRELLSWRRSLFFR